MSLVVSKVLSSVANRVLIFASYLRIVSDTFAHVKLGYELLPNESYTLEQLLELDLEPFQEQIEKVIIVLKRAHLVLFE